MLRAIIRVKACCCCWGQNPYKIAVNLPEVEVDDLPHVDEAGDAQSDREHNEYTDQVTHATGHNSVQ